ncbi:MAG: AAA family ATPase [Actinophytocola sp.]|uniref:AAA family ATPase n=1 Tax=Actinophytocola sp. TaxID=1872138 RepID=UPI003D6B127A
MIVWLDGAFGAGKTTLAEELHRRLPDALPFDPEHVGFVLRQWVPVPSGDFQDLPLWRSLTAEFAIGLDREYGRHVITPMTLADSGYCTEIFDRLAAADVPVLHVFLDVAPDELRRRIHAQVLSPDDPSADAVARDFRLRNVDRCIAARAALGPETLMLRADREDPPRLADRVLAALG